MCLFGLSFKELVLEKDDHEKVSDLYQIPHLVFPLFQLAKLQKKLCYIWIRSLEELSENKMIRISHFFFFFFVLFCT